MTFHIIEGGVTAAKGFQASGIHPQKSQQSRPCFDLQ